MCTTEGSYRDHADGGAGGGGALAPPHFCEIKNKMIIIISADFL